jgi:hypothetical protein
MWALLLWREQAGVTFRATTTGGLDGGPAALLEQVKHPAHRRVAQARHLHQPHDFDAPLVQSDDLLSPLMQLLQCLVSRVFFFHDTLEQPNTLKFNLYEAGSIRH